MSDGPQRPGWYSNRGDMDDLAYFDGHRWTWRRRRDASGSWHQEALVSSQPATASGLDTSEVPPPEQDTGASDTAPEPAAAEGPVGTGSGPSTETAPPPQGETEPSPARPGWWTPSPGAGTAGFPEPSLPPFRRATEPPEPGMVPARTPPGTGVPLGEPLPPLRPQQEEPSDPTAQQSSADLWSEQFAEPPLPPFRRQPVDQDRSEAVPPLLPEAGEEVAGPPDRADEPSAAALWSQQLAEPPLPPFRPGGEGEPPDAPGGGSTSSDEAAHPGPEPGLERSATPRDPDRPEAAPPRPPDAAPPADLPPPPMPAPPPTWVTGANPPTPPPAGPPGETPGDRPPPPLPPPPPTWGQGAAMGQSPPPPGPPYGLGSQGPPTLPPGATSWWPPGGQPPPPAGRLDLLVHEPQRQARWKTLLRLVLALPNLIVLSILFFVVEIVVVIMWFCALFTAQVPRSLWSFVRGVLQWQAHAYAYLYFLTDRYPPFSMDDVPYPVTLTLAGPPPRLNRAAVLFRLVIVVPASFLEGFFNAGLAIVAFACWCATLVLGRAPRPLHLTLAAGLRYLLRLYAYFFLLTPEYPWGLLGDGPAAAGTLEGGTLALKGAAKKLAIATLAVGVILYVGEWVVAIPTFVGVQRTSTAAVQWEDLNIQARTAAENYLEADEGCGRNLDCVDNASSILVNSLGTQISGLQSIDFPTATSRDGALELIPLLEHQQQIAETMKTARSVDAYLREVKAIATLTRTIQPIANRINEAMERYSVNPVA